MVAPRLTGVSERMEQPGVDPTELARSLRDLARINRAFRATSVMLRHLRPLLAGTASPVRILDVGTGYADIPRAIVEWARRQGVAVEVEALEGHAGIRHLARLACAEYPEIRLQAGDALSLPYADGSVDITIASQVLHHMEGEAPIRMLRELYRVARHGVVVSDLHRGFWPFLGTWITLHLASRNSIIHYDGPLSIRRGFVPQELLALAASAGWKDARVARHTVVRLVLSVRKEGSAAGPHGILFPRGAPHG